ncbi:CU044_2847 family protein [Streptomyces sp. NBC_01142]|uniref:CU044_2847 family protein n=1 Tax=Streptomyces sp. NBC_01142 TaxID=2975865 RepID=UPI002251C12A|nr:CU044_2847 family protein [Streptomyces sp. NBC_01142]MCX4821425.1 CU044_2847 family protein [Streptomyces sp. NBC_01142]
MSTFTELQLADGTAIRFELAPAQGAPSGAEPADGRAADPANELPDGMGQSVPVARGGQTVSAFAVETLRRTLQPLSTLLEEVHDAVLAAEHPPQEVNVSFGIQVGHDLKLGIVGGNGQAHITVSATWQPAAPRT